MVDAYAQRHAGYFIAYDDYYFLLLSIMCRPYQLLDAWTTSDANVSDYQSSLVATFS